MERDFNKSTAEVFDDALGVAEDLAEALGEADFVELSKSVKLAAPLASPAGLGSGAGAFTDPGGLVRVSDVVESGVDFEGAVV